MGDANAIKGCLFFFQSETEQIKSLNIEWARGITSVLWMDGVVQINFGNWDISSDKPTLTNLWFWTNWTVIDYYCYVRSTVMAWSNYMEIISYSICVISSLISFERNTKVNYFLMSNGRKQNRIQKFEKLWIYKVEPQESMMDSMN